MLIVIFVNGPVDLADSVDAIDLISFDFEMFVINWRLFSSVNVIVTHIFVDPPNVIQLDADEVPHVVNVNVHLVVEITDCDTIE